MPLKKRKIDLEFSGDIDRHWLANKPFETHWLNAYTLLIPDGEKFIIRTCRKYRDRVSPKLLTEIQGLFYQEGQHSLYHRQAVDIYRRQGYRVDSFTKVTGFFCYRVMEAVSPAILALSTASAIEHVNMAIAEHYLAEEPFMDKSNTKLVRMFAWHFAEEIEHKRVVFDVLSEMQSNPFIRFLGLFMAITNFVGLLYLGAFYLAYQDRSLFKTSFWRDFWHFNVSKQFIAKLWQGSRLYMKESFHPSEVANDHLVGKGIDIYHVLKGA